MQSDTYNGIFGDGGALGNIFMAAMSQDRGDQEERGEHPSWVEWIQYHGEGEGCRRREGEWRGRKERVGEGEREKGGRKRVRERE